jgi:hypothetical protein
MMNISEFERTKPTKTFKLIVGTISKYEHLRDNHKEIMDTSDAALFNAYDNIVKELKTIQKSFLAGE